MYLDAVIGCDAVHASPDRLRLETADGTTRNTPWSAIKVAGMGQRLEGHVKILGVTDKAAPFSSTHDPVWIVYAHDGLALLMLEKVSAKSDVILQDLADYLEDRWSGDDLQESDVTDATLIPPTIQLPKSVVMTLAFVAIAFFAAVAILFFMHGAKPTAP